jgi:hypothetical protein
VQATQIELAGDIEVDLDDSIMGYLSYPEELPAAAPFTAPDLEGLSEQTIPVSNGDEVVRLTAGLYPEGLNATSGVFQLKGGIFFFGDEGIVLSGSAEMRTRDCIIVLDKNASIILDGTEAFIQKPNPQNTELSDWSSISIISRQSTTDCTILLLNGASMSCAGRIMCPMANVRLNESDLSTTGMHVSTVDVERGATLTLGDGTQHPHTIQIVQ